MKTRLLTLFLSCAVAFQLQAQQPAAHCESNDRLQQQLADPQQRQAYEDLQGRMEEYLVQHPDGNPMRTTVYIPVIFHVLYNTPAGNVPVLRLIEQLQVLNEDYGRYNTDAVNVPSVWQSIASNTDIQFCLAHTDPSGNWTDGYEYFPSTSSTDWCISANVFATVPAWNPNDYLNIWVVECTNGVLGYASFPGGPIAEDGVVISHNYIGKTGAPAPYNLGRTGTHEVGHWLNLIHIWGDDGGACTGTDQVADTPNQASEHYGCYPVGSVQTDACTPSAPGTMWMNYMDYTDDACMYMFTAGQKARMWATLNGPRAPILLSNKCTVTGIATLEGSAPQLFPSPTDGQFTLSFPAGYGSIDEVVITTLTGQTVQRLQQPALAGNRLELDLSACAAGVYLVEVRSVAGSSVQKVVRN